jgi:hypothetical protein
MSPEVARSVSAGTHGYFRSWGWTGCAIRLPATAALDPNSDIRLPLGRAVQKYARHDESKVLHETASRRRRQAERAPVVRRIVSQNAALPIN